MWDGGWRDRAWERLGEPWDLVVVGGGITGAGLLREATRLGWRTLLLEARDFGWGTSSRSSKLVHGGLRYLKEGRLALTRDSVRERDRLLREGAGLVHPLHFVFPTRRGDAAGRAMLGLGLSVYEALAWRRGHRRLSTDAVRALAPHLATDDLSGAYRYGDAQTDDARLVLRVLREAVAAGGTALNHASVRGLLRAGGRVAGVRVRDAVSGREAEVRARVVVNATGAAADRLRAEVGAPARLRPLRGSHLLLPAWRLPLAQAVTAPHPRDRRPVYAIPWEGVVLVGTTDLDHADDAGREPRISPAETAYLLEALHAWFPSLELHGGDVLATFAGVRPVVGTGAADPSRESRDHVVWEEDGLLTVTGGKLTTFRLIARDALRIVARRLPAPRRPRGDRRVLDPVAADAARDALPAAAALRLAGRYGAEAAPLLSAVPREEWEPVPGTVVPWAELRWAARAEGVVHLDDLLLRRARIGLLLPGGGRAVLPRVRAVCQGELGWSDVRWDAEEAAYLALWRAAHAPEPADDAAPARMQTFPA